jgi:hypothetical protein
LLDKDYLSLAEVQVMGTDLLRFAEVGYSRASNNFSGWHDAPNYPNWGAFAILQGDGSIKAWGSSGHGLNDFFGIRRNMKVLLIGVGTEVCFIRNANLIIT